jgi:hypothetical protein
MNSAGLFIYGFIVTILVVAAAGLLVWGAILDGRYENEMRESREAADRLPMAERAPRP